MNTEYRSTVDIPGPGRVKRAPLIKDFMARPDKIMVITYDSLREAIAASQSFVQLSRRNGLRYTVQRRVNVVYIIKEDNNEL